MTRSYRKNTLRTFKSTASRFAAVFAIVALGVGFLAGLNATPIDMKESMERYMDDGNFYDLRIVSTLGLTDEDVDAYATKLGEGYGMSLTEIKSAVPTDNLEGGARVDKAARILYDAAIHGPAEEEKKEEAAEKTEDAAE